MSLHTAIVTAAPGKGDRFNGITGTVRLRQGNEGLYEFQLDEPEGHVILLRAGEFELVGE